jgi:hypothetical protein
MDWIGRLAKRGWGYYCVRNPWLSIILKINATFVIQTPPNRTGLSTRVVLFVFLCAMSSETDDDWEAESEFRHGVDRSLWLQKVISPLFLQVLHHFQSN